MKPVETLLSTRNGFLHQDSTPEISLHMHVMWRHDASEPIALPQACLSMPESLAQEAGLCANVVGAEAILASKVVQHRQVQWYNLDDVKISACHVAGAEASLPFRGASKGLQMALSCCTSKPFQEPVSCKITPQYMGKDGKMKGDFA